MLSEYPKVAVSGITKAIRSPIKYLFPEVFKQAETVAADTASALRSQAVSKAKDELLSGNISQAGETLYKGITEGIAERRKVKEAEALLKEASDKAEAERLAAQKEAEMKAAPKSDIMLAIESLGKEMEAREAQKAEKKRNSDEIKAAFRRLAKLFHPDKNPQGKEQLDRKSTRLNSSH